MAKVKKKQKRGGGMMEKIGFQIIDGEVIAYADDDGNAITPKQWREQNAEM